MELKIKAIHFDATEKLHAFIEKKAQKLAKRNEDINLLEVVMKVVKPETNMNKEVAVHVSLKGLDLHAEKVADTFEEGFDLCLEALERPLEKHKNK